MKNNTCMNGSISACRTLFDSKYHIAKGILPLLHEEDVKIAFAKRLSYLQRGSIRENETKTGSIEREINNLYACGRSVLDYINVNGTGNISDHMLFAEPISYRAGRSTAQLKHDDTQKDETIETVETTKTTHGLSSEKPSVEKSKHTGEKSFFYRGKMLPRKMRLGTYLYFRGIISRRMLNDSLHWQRKQRPMIGQMTLQIGILSLSDFSRMLLLTKDGTPFGIVARRNGLLNGAAINTILNAQKRFDKPLGKFFIERGVLTPKQTDLLVQELHIHNARYSDHAPLRIPHENFLSNT